MRYHALTLDQHLLIQSQLVENTGAIWKDGKPSTIGICIRSCFEKGKFDSSVGQTVGESEASDRGTHNDNVERPLTVGFGHCRNTERSAWSRVFVRSLKGHSEEEQIIMIVGHNSDMRNQVDIVIPLGLGSGARMLHIMSSVGTLSTGTFCLVTGHGRAGTTGKRSGRGHI